MENNNNTIITFSNPETAYLYGLGQSIANLSKVYQQSVVNNNTIYENVAKKANDQISDIHNKAMEVIKNSKIKLEK